MQEKRATNVIWRRPAWVDGRALSYNAADIMDRLLFLHLERNSMDREGFYVM